MLVTADNDKTLRLSVTAKNTPGSRHRDVDPDGRDRPLAPPSVVTLPSGGKSIDAPTSSRRRCSIDKVSFSPNPLRSRAAFTAKIHVSDTRGFAVRNALVFVAGPPLRPLVHPGRGQDRLRRHGDADAHPDPQAPAPAGRDARHVRARSRGGDKLIAGASARRLVNLRVSPVSLETLRDGLASLEPAGGGGLLGGMPPAAGRRGGAGLLAGGVPVSPDTARKILCDANIIPVVCDGDSEVLDVGRSTRTIPVGIRRALVVRDQGCVFPGCDRPPSWADAHHCIYWSDGGETKLSNLVLLCRHHHDVIHHDGWHAFIHGRLPWFIPPPLHRPRPNPDPTPPPPKNRPL